MDWTKSGRRDSFRYVRVSYPDFKEIDTLDGITSCTIDESAFTTLKMSGKLDFDELPEWAHNLGDDMIRIYSISKLGDQTEKVCHATMLATSTSAAFTGIRKSGEYSLYSTLKILQDDKITESISVSKGTNIVNWVVGQIKEHHLPVSVTKSEAVTQSDTVFEFGTELIKVLNELLTGIGYRSLYVDAYGTVCITPSVALDSQEPACTMSDTDPNLAISSANFETEFDTSEIPNYVVVISEDEEGNSYRAVAANNDIHSPWSIQNRHRRIPRCEKIDKCHSVKQLQDKADQLLKESMMKVEKITIEHLWQPFDILDAINFQYTKSGKSGKYSAAQRSREMKPGIPCKTTMRRFVQLADITKEALADEQR